MTEQSLLEYRKCGIHHQKLAHLEPVKVHIDEITRSSAFEKLNEKSDLYLGMTGVSKDKHVYLLVHKSALIKALAPKYNRHGFSRYYSGDSETLRSFGLGFLIPKQFLGVG